MEDKISALKSETATASESKDSEVAQLKTQTSTLEANLKEIETSNASLKEELKQKDSDLTEKDDVITKLNTQVESGQEEVKRLKEFESETVKLRDAVKELEESKSSLAKQLESLQGCFSIDLVILMSYEKFLRFSI